MEEIDINYFFDHDSPIESLREPFVYGGRLIATDGSSLFYRPAPKSAHFREGENVPGWLLKILKLIEAPGMILEFAPLPLISDTPLVRKKYRGRYIKTVDACFIKYVCGVKVDARRFFPLGLVSGVDVARAGHFQIVAFRHGETRGAIVGLM